MSDYDSEAFDDIPLDSVSLGTRLRAAREANGFGIEEAASLLNLDESLVQALENDDYEDLPSPIFIRGYLRAYGKLLRLDGNELIELYGQQTGTLEPNLSSMSSVEKQPGSRDPLIRWLSIGIISGLLLLSGIWWFLQSGDDQSSVAEGEVIAPIAEVPSGSGDVPLPKLQPVEPDSAIADAASETSGEADSTAGDEARNDVQSVVENLLEQRQWADEVSSPTDEVAQVAPEAEAAESEVASAVTDELQSTAEEEPVAPVVEVAAADLAPTPSAPKPAVSAPIGSDKLTVSVASGKSWAEIFDASGSRLFYGMLEEGDSKTLTGGAPFKLFLGNSPAVAVELNGESVDQGKYNRRDNTARFVVDTNGVRRR